MSESTTPRLDALIDVVDRLEERLGEIEQDLIALRNAINVIIADNPTVTPE